MNITRHSTFFLLSRIAVLLIYVPFFTVQCFLSYSNLAQVKTDTFQTSYKRQTSKTPLSIADAEKKSQEKQVTINLNKRFQPGSMSYFLNTSFEVPVYFFEASVFISYLNSLLPTSHLYTGPLRGPPAFV